MVNLQGTYYHGVYTGFKEDEIEDNEYIKAPTLIEMEKWFPEKIVCNGREYKVVKYWDRIEYVEVCKIWFFVEANTPPNTYAKAVIWLKENGYITFKKEGT